MPDAGFQRIGQNHWKTVIRKARSARLFFKIEQERAFANRKIKFEWDSVAEELIADGEPETLRGIKIKNLKTDEEKIINVDAVFLAIGHKPNTDIFKRFLEKMVSWPETVVLDNQEVFQLRVNWLQ